jgi:uncharacterized protein YaiE (UPF0345 family)
MKRYINVIFVFSFEPQQMKPQCLFLFLMAMCLNAYGQSGVRLNEITGSNDTTPGEIWVEIFNNSSESLDLTDFQIITQGKVFEFPDTAKLYPLSYYAIVLSGYQLLVADKISLIEKSRPDKHLDSLFVPLFRSGESFARLPDGTGSWNIVSPASLNATNLPDYLSPGTDSPDWVNCTLNAEFFLRDGAGAVVFNDEMWLLGGWKNGPTTNEIWKSTDGVHWTLVTLAPWPGRHSSGFVLFDNKLWVIGGDLNADVWSSSNGVDWELVTDTPPWGKRYSPYVAAYDNKLWFMGGLSWLQVDETHYDFSQVTGYNDVWSSTNGHDWTLVTAHAPWQPRGLIHGYTVFQNKLWIMGGGLKGFNTTADYNDVWNTEDGVHWTCVSAHAPWDPRTHYSNIVYNNKIWITDGSLNGLQSNLSNEVWNSADGVNWNRISTSTIWGPRHASSLFNYKGSLWLVAGFLDNQVWRYTDSPKSYYLKSSGDYTDITSWGTEPDGSGVNPPGFEIVNGIFVFANRDHLIIDSTFPLSGDNSYVVVGNGEDSITVEVTNASLISAGIELNKLATLKVTGTPALNVKKIHSQSTIVLSEPAANPIPDLPYYNLTIQSSDVVVLPQQLVVLGDLKIDCKDVSDAEELKLYGNVRINTELNSKNFNSLSILGQRDQKVFINDSAQLHDFVISKPGGNVVLQSVFAGAANTVINMQGNSLLDPTMKDIRGTGKFLLTGRGSDNFVDGMRVCYSTDAALDNVLSIDAIETKYFSVDQQGSQKLNFKSVLLKTDSLQLTISNQDSVSVGLLKFSVTSLASFKQTESRPLVLPSLELTITSPSEARVASDHGLTLSNFKLIKAETLVIDTHDPLVVSDTVVFNAGKLKFQGTSALVISDSCNVVFEGSEKNAGENYLGNKMIFRSLTVNCPNITLTKKINVDDIFLNKGSLTCMDTIEVRQAIHFQDNNFVKLGDNAGVIAHVRGDGFFLPVARDSFYMPLFIKPKNPGGNERIFINLEKTQSSLLNNPSYSKYLLQYGWRIKKMDRGFSSYELKVFWPMNLKSDSLISSKTAFNLFTNGEFFRAIPTQSEIFSSDLLTANDVFDIDDDLLVVGESISEILKTPQQYDCNFSDPVYYTDQVMKLPNATAEGLPVTLTVLNAAVASVSDYTLSILESGSLKILVTQAGDSVFRSLQKICKLEVLRSPPMLSLIAPDEIELKSAAVPLMVTSLSDGAITFTTDNADIAEIVDGALLVKKPGYCEVTASQQGTSRYEEALVKKSIEVKEKSAAVTLDAFAIVSNQLRVNGALIENGGAGDIEFGICWNASGMPTLQDSTLSAVGNIGKFEFTITALKENSLYYLRAYARNSRGVVYSNAIAAAIPFFDKPGSTKQALYVYPIPVENILTVENPGRTGEARVALYNASGSVIYNRVLNYDDFPLYIDLSSQSAGVLFLNVDDELGSRSLKIFKK